ncbi:MAG: HAD-IB family hydrolase [Gammaproteobacteria bacterium]|nr:HAD family hydrolase [Rhodocyclaceae bacterium]MBU3907608.1 HAD-IB family hydrolase [Gammaproteobacteria bacterium]MBU3990904.1 HAD-IB family hydrolase [Gammaproteobacteria bacterium]MBU4004254.1 HAD-IB family hydrolase [Gammaproteobacteria bacterium]MBU4019663.1 HAD-IB family hydrolase [Gammaproteobacteria bacterium]
MNLTLFDLDNTLLSGDSDFEWAQFLITKGVLDREVHEAKNQTFYDEYKAGVLDIHVFLQFQLAPLARHPRAELDAWHAEFMTTRILPQISGAARALVDQHLASGDLCAIVTATNSFVTGPICREFNIPHLVATIPAHQDGQFTGAPRGTPAFREGKIERVEAWLESLGLWWGAFELSTFYSDSLNDLPLLAKVSHPVAVDPDDTLRAHSDKQGWPILSLRV